MTDLVLNKLDHLHNEVAAVRVGLAEVRTDLAAFRSEFEKHEQRESRRLDDLDTAIQETRTHATASDLAGKRSARSWGVVSASAAVASAILIAIQIAFAKTN